MKLVVIGALLVSLCNGAKILGVFNHPGASHTLLGNFLLRKLAERGHQVVMISSFPMSESIPNYKDISLPGPLEDLERRNKRKKHLPMAVGEIINMTLQHTEDTFINADVQELIHSNETFDIIIVDWFYNEATLMFGHIFKAPVVYMSSFGNNALLTDFTGNVLPFSYVPGAGLLADDNMSFKQRILMTLILGAYNIYRPKLYKNHHEILKRHFENPPTIEELQENVALVLSNSHFSFETPRPYTPNIIPIGGFHVEESKELPQDLKEFLDSATDGVIFFSLGSQLDSTIFTQEVLTNILAAVSRLPQKVLWKSSAEITNAPKNLRIMKWVPQAEVLAHPNVKLFITHGGMLSVIEAIHYSVPLLCVPFNGDQLTNAAFISSREIGRHISQTNITEDSLYESVQEIITNPRYQLQMDYRSALLRQQPVKPLDAAIYWVEHVIKFKTGDHLRTFATKLEWYKYYLLDVIAFFVCCLYIVLKLVHYTIKAIVKGACYLLCKAKNTKIKAE